MSQRVFEGVVISIALGFFAIFMAVVVPPLLEHPDVPGAFAAGFVNPYSSGYSSDVIACWLILMAWVAYEAKHVRYGWVCVLLGVVPGVAVGLAGYLVLRGRQLRDAAS
ncbi:MAG: DUF2834 domain-containing protein [Myxococcota bacterium]